MADNKNIEAEEFEPEVIVLENDLGEEREFYFLDVVEFEGEEYVILMPADDEEDNDAVILKIESIDDETESYCGIDDVDLLNKVFNVFKEKHAEEFDGE